MFEPLLVSLDLASIVYMRARIVATMDVGCLSAMAVVATHTHALERIGHRSFPFGTNLPISKSIKYTAIPTALLSSTDNMMYEKNIDSSAIRKGGMFHHGRAIARSGNHR
jgi:hypothetical protein